MQPNASYWEGLPGDTKKYLVLGIHRNWSRVMLRDLCECMYEKRFLCTALTQPRCFCMTMSFKYHLEISTSAWQIRTNILSCTLLLLLTVVVIT